MTIYIRQAKPQDARVVAPIIIEAIGDIVKRLTEEQSPTHLEKQNLLHKQICLPPATFSLKHCDSL